MVTTFNFSSKKFLITGASSGIGRQTAISISNQAGQVILTGRNEEKLQETKDIIARDTSYIAPCYTMDMTNANEIELFAENCENLDGLVFAAGIDLILPLRKTTPEKFKNVIDTNLISCYNLIWHLLKKKKINENGSIVLLASVEGYNITSAAHAAYGVSKAAIVVLTKYLALELASSKIRVNALAPAVVDTPMIVKWKTVLTQEQLQHDISRYPLQRYGQTQEITDACCFLLSDLSKWTTGSSLVVDGGLSLV